MEISKENIIEYGFCWVASGIQQNAGEIFFWNSNEGWQSDWFNSTKFDTTEEAINKYRKTLVRSDYFLSGKKTKLPGAIYVDFKTIKLIKTLTMFENIEADEMVVDLRHIRQKELLTNIIPKNAIGDLDLQEIAILHKLEDDKLDEEIDNPFDDGIQF